MEDKEKHINQKPDDKYPAPDVPVKDAWAQMKDMLDTELPDGSPTPEKTNFLTKSWKFLSVLVILLCLLLSVFYKTSKNSLPEITSQSATVHADELKSPQKTSSDQGHAHVTPDSNSAIIAKDEREASKLSQQSDVKESSPNTILDKSQPTDITRSSNFLRENNRAKSGSATAEEVKLNKNNRTAILSKRNKGYLNKQYFKQSTDYDQVTNTTRFKSTRDFQLQPDRTAVSDRKNFKSDNLYNVNFITGRNLNFSTNVLKNTFAGIEIAIPALAPTGSQSSATRNSSQILKNIHFGLQWNAVIPMNGFENYFKNTDGENRYYTPLIPGLWISKEFKDGNELLLKLSAYQQYFANNKEVNSSLVYLADSTYISRSTALIKIIGMSAAIQYNFKISDHWSLGVGVQSSLQQKALLSTRSEHYAIDSLSIPKLLSITDSLSGIKHSSDQWQYMSNYHIAGNAEIIYNWHRFQLGMGVVIPFKSMTNTSYARLRPLSGQVSFRWRIR
ncbi:hypothetical protein [Dyadobacter sp. CY312]|uniref:hypothetical protein n=1 Tax=Dyadobacter sp. CY312 TaxID=2907303 RepID=UPI001F22417C|nr:hypothetical protein [Dyadobacter sp. CY312]MCE7040680.1 hypothetical protein [Dyadobacter sp. CY312]